MSELGDSPGDGGNEDEGGDATGDDGQGCSDPGGDEARLQISELGSSLRENHDDRIHPAPEMIRRYELTDGMTKNGAHRIPGPHQGQTDKR